MIKRGLCFLTAIMVFVGMSAGVSSAQPSDQENPIPAPTIGVYAQTDKAKYSLSDGIQIMAILVNESSRDVYIDKRMFWTGLSGGLALEIGDEQGNHVPAHALGDAMMPPPSPDDTSILMRLEPGFLYGSYVRLILKDFFPKPGRYSIRVTYNSMLPRDLVAPQLRDLPAIWMGAPWITSKPIWIDVTQ
jgi:hypothetical protein